MYTIQHTRAHEIKHLYNPPLHKVDNPTARKVHSTVSNGTASPSSVVCLPGTCLDLVLSLGTVRMDCLEEADMGTLLGEYAVGAKH